MAREKSNKSRTQGIELCQQNQSWKGYGSNRKLKQPIGPI